MKCTQHNRDLCYALTSRLDYFQRDTKQRKSKCTRICGSSLMQNIITRIQSETLLPNKLNISFHKCNFVNIYTI